METTSCVGVRTPARGARAAGTIPGLGATMTISAPAAASALLATARTPSAPSTARRASTGSATATRSGEARPRSRIARMSASAITPPPMKAYRMEDPRAWSRRGEGGLQSQEAGEDGKGHVRLLTYLEGERSDPPAGY